MTFTAHDVRKLRLCFVCNRIGHLDYLLTLPAGLAHGECAVRSLDRGALLTLPLADRQKLTLADTGVDVMQALLACGDEP